MFKLEYILKIFKYKLLILNFSNYSNEKYSKFTSNFLDDQDFSNFMRGVDKGGLDKGGLDKGGLDKGGLDKGGTGQRVLRYLLELYTNYLRDKITKLEFLQLRLSYTIIYSHIIMSSTMKLLKKQI